MTFIPANLIPPVSRVSGTVPPGRHYFWVRERVDNIIRYMGYGCIFVVPLTLAFFSKKYAAALIAAEFASYYIGTLICVFDSWYNQRVSDLKPQEEERYPEEKFANPELSKILQRLQQLSWHYGISPFDLYYYLDRDEVPLENLDWIEAVSLLNQLSLYIGKRFENEEQKEK